LDHRLKRLEQRYPRSVASAAQEAESALRVAVLTTLAPVELAALEEHLLHLQSDPSAEPSEVAAYSLKTYNHRLCELNTAGSPTIGGRMIMR
jgi:hypothetical protein